MADPFVQVATLLLAVPGDKAVLAACSQLTDVPVTREILRKSKVGPALVAALKKASPAVRAQGAKLRQSWIRALSGSACPPAGATGARAVPTGAPVSPTKGSSKAGELSATPSPKRHRPAQSTPDKVSPPASAFGTTVKPLNFRRKPSKQDPKRVKKSKAKHQKVLKSRSRKALRLREAEEDPELEAEEWLDSDVDGQPSSQSESVAGDIGSLVSMPSADDGYPAEAWDGCPLPGEPGFAAAARQALTAGSGWRPGYVVDGLRDHQARIGFLAHPKSPCTRLLVDHVMGAGKTLEMILVLQNYFHDPRPKILVFPKDRVCNQFYRELLTWPSRWRDFVCLHMEDHANVLADGPWRRRRSEKWDLSRRNRTLLWKGCEEGTLEAYLALLETIAKSVLELKRTLRNGTRLGSARVAFLAQFPEEWYPAAPLRAYRYTTAGGCLSKLNEDGRPRNPLLKIGYDPSKPLWSHKVVLVDEGHHLTRPSPQFQAQLTTLRKHLYRAESTSLYVFTGTIADNVPADARALLKTVQGAVARARGAGVEGFLSSYCARPEEDFARAVPGGVADGALDGEGWSALVRKAVLAGPALVRYVLKERKELVPAARLGNFTNMYVHFASFSQEKAFNRLTSAPAQYCPKLHAVCRHVSLLPDKAVVMCSNRTGFRTLLELLRNAGKQGGFGVATVAQQADFNDSTTNLRGEIYRVLVADSASCSEGVSFLGVRRHHLVDVPRNFSAFTQQVARSVRLRGHDGLPAQERNVRVHLWAAAGDTTYKHCLETFALEAVLGVYGGARKSRTEEVGPEEAARRLAACWREGGCKDVGDLRTQVQSESRTLDLSEDALQTLVGRRWKRVQRALLHLRDGGEVGDPVGGQSVDVTALSALQDSCRVMQQGLAEIRVQAVDAGL